MSNFPGPRRKDLDYSFASKRVVREDWQEACKELAEFARLNLLDFTRLSNDADLWEIAWFTQDHMRIVSIDGMILSVQFIVTEDDGEKLTIAGVGSTDPFNHPHVFEKDGQLISKVVFGDIQLATWTSSHNTLYYAPLKEAIPSV